MTNYIGPSNDEKASRAAMAAALSTVIDLGNNESMSRGIFENADGTFLAMTFTQSKTFKTRAGAERWLVRKLGR